MKKIKSVFERNYDGERTIYNTVVPGSEWVLDGEGVATIKFDGTSCMIRDGKLYKRYDRKITKKFKKLIGTDGFVPTEEHFKAVSDDWESCEDNPNLHTAHWPGWVPVVEGDPASKYHLEAMDETLHDGTYELIGPKLQKNPHGFDCHRLMKHGDVVVDDFPRTFEGMKAFFEEHGSEMEGVVFHHPDGKMVKVKSNDFFPKTWNN